MGRQHKINRLWCKGEVVQLKGGKDLYRVFKVYSDWYSVDHVMLEKIKGKQMLDFIDNKNMIKVTKSDRKCTQVRLPTLMFLLRL